MREKSERDRETERKTHREKERHAQREIDRERQRARLRERKKSEDMCSTVYFGSRYLGVRGPLAPLLSDEVIRKVAILMI